MSDTPKNMFYSRLSQVSKDSSSVASEILTLVDIILFRNRKTAVVDMHQVLGSDKFIELLYAVGGQTITFPSVEEFREVFEWALCYYAREVQNRDWKDIKAELGLDASAMKWSTRNKQLSAFISEILYKKMSEADMEQVMRELHTRYKALNSDE